jgi:signal transduction histidine kinase
MFLRLETWVRRIKQFTADASHELRAPIALIRDNCEMQCKEGIDNWEYLEPLEEILEEFERTLPVVDYMLSSRVQVRLTDDLCPLDRARSHGPPKGRYLGIDYAHGENLVGFM